MTVLLDIKDDKASDVLKVLKSMPYVKITLISEEKSVLMGEIKEAVEELNLIKKGKLKGISAKQLLAEL